MFSYNKKTMNPVLSELKLEDDHLYFTLSGVNVSIANSLRRIILSEIPCVVFRTSPYEQNRANIEINTSRLNNELIKQRISCVPIHISDEAFPIDDHIVEVDLTNDTEEVIYLTTQDFKVKNIASNTYLNRQQVKEIFPPDKITGDYIDIARLRPKMSDMIEGEQIKMTLKFDIGHAKQDSAFNVVSTCAYGATPNLEEIKRVWTSKSEELKSKNVPDDEILIAEKDWRLLEGKRYTVPDSFDFVIESVGQFMVADIVKKATDVMLSKIESFKNIINKNGNQIINNSKSTIPNCYDITLDGEDYTLGKVLEYILYANYFDTETSSLNLSYCGFSKPHPHINRSIIRVGFVNNNSSDNVKELMIIVCDIATDVYKQMNENLVIDDN